MEKKDSHITKNAQDIERELLWLKNILKARSDINASKGISHNEITNIPPPDLTNSTSEFAQLITNYKFGFTERLVFILALTPHIKPELLDIFFQVNELTRQPYTEFGGKKGTRHSGFLPTGETAAFIYAGYDLDKRFSLTKLFDTNHTFSRCDILKIEPTDGEPVLSGELTISEEIRDLITLGEIRKPDFNTEFPAKLLKTDLNWDDLVLNPGTRSRIAEVETWVKYHPLLMNDPEMSRKLKPGYRALFYGPPGTGKSVTAALLGKRTGRDVYKIDLSKIVSKYIGETEKNLSNVFDKAEHKGWILFFDEADALFGKRTNVQDAQDRYANQEVSYLLQRIEDYDGLVILATNLKNNIDEAFARRFQSFIRFPMPQPEERRLLWRNYFSESIQPEEKIDFQKIAADYELAGGSIINVVQYSSLKALARNSTIIKLSDLEEGIKREFHKSGKSL